MASQRPNWTRVYDPNAVASIQTDTKNGLWDLNEYECWWRDHQQFLQTRGYMLRPRFRPGWKPSWLGTNFLPDYCEDSLMNMHAKTIDATRISDGMTVFIKKVPVASNELSICRFLSSPERLMNPANHCVHILDSFSDDLDSNYCFIVMPLLRYFDDPPFFSVDEVIDFFKQVLEGLIYIHDQDVAHRDLSSLNIMFDAKKLFPDGYHPSSPSVIPSLLEIVKPLKRSEVAGIKYYFTDFGLSSQFSNNERNRLVIGTLAQDPDIPELSAHIPYDPFAVDIFTLGNLFKKDFVEQYSNLAFLRPLTISMTSQNPSSRPNAKAAFKHFQALLSEQSASSLKWRLQRPNETTSQRLKADFIFFFSRLTKNRIFLTSFFSVAVGSFVSLLYGPRVVFHRLKMMTNRFLTR